MVGGALSTLGVIALALPPAAVVLLAFLPLGAAYPLLLLGLSVGDNAPPPPLLPVLLSLIYAALLLLLLLLAPCVQRFQLMSTDVLSTEGLPEPFFCREAVEEAERRHALGRARGGGCECTVCCELVAPPDEVLLVDACSHGFHRECIAQWLGQHPGSSSCPNCRARIGSLTPVFAC